MDERILEGIMELIWKQNQIQEGLRHEMELRNDLKVNAMLNDKRLYDSDFIEMGIDDVTREKLYAKLSDEDRSILERYREVNTNSNDELELYAITLKGLPRGNENNKVYEFVGKLQSGILEDVYNEKELYEYFERVLEKNGESLLSLEGCWETEWLEHRTVIMDNDEKSVYYGSKGFDEKEVEEYKRKFMEKYENRMTKGYFEKAKEERKRKEKESERLMQERKKELAERRKQNNGNLW